MYLLNSIVLDIRSRYSSIVIDLMFIIFHIGRQLFTILNCVWKPAEEFGRPNCLSKPRQMSKPKMLWQVMFNVLWSNSQDLRPEKRVNSSMWGVSSMLSLLQIYQLFLIPGILCISGFYTNLLRPYIPHAPSDIDNSPVPCIQSISFGKTIW